MGSIFLQKNTSHMTKSLQPWKIRDFHLSFGVKGEFPNPEAFYSFSLLTKNPPRVLKPKFCFFHPEVQGREIGKLRSWSWSLHERSLGKPFFLSRPKSKIWSETKFGRIFSHETSKKTSVGRCFVSYHSRIKMTMDEKEEHKQQSPSVECMEVSSRYQQTTCSRYTLINWSSPWFTVTIDSEIATKAGCHVPYQLPMF